jgi:hypothetical protein
MSEFEIPTHQEARELARDVSSGQTRSYVRAAMLLANYVKCCLACKIEAEIGTEKDPHPIPARFHVCKEPR